VSYLGGEKGIHITAECFPNSSHYRTKGSEKRKESKEQGQ